MPPQMCVTCKSSLPAHLPGLPALSTGLWHTAGSLVALRSPVRWKLVRQSAAGGLEWLRPALTSNKHRQAPAESRPTALAAQARPHIACPTITSASLWSRAPNPGTADDGKDGAQPRGVNKGQPHSRPYVESRASWGPQAQHRAAACPEVSMRHQAAA